MTEPTGAPSATGQPSSGPTAARRRLGSQLRRLRESAGVSGEQAAAVLDGSQAKISRLESGVTRPSVADVRELLEYYRVDEAMKAELLRLARLAAERSRSWWRDYIDAFGVQIRQRAALESEASAILQCCPFIIPGLLQIPEYTQEVFRRTGHEVSRENIDLAVSYQAARKKHVLKNLSRYQILTTDSALRWRPVADFNLTNQLTEIVREIQGNPRLELRILAKYPLDGLLAQPDFSIFTFGDEAVPAAGYLEFPTGVQQLEQSAEVAYYNKVFATLWENSLSRDDSLKYLQDLVEKAREDKDITQ